MRPRFGFALLILATLSARAQEIQINRQNRTIAVTAEGSAAADPEVAIIRMSYHNFAKTYDAAFQENVRVSGQVLQALLASNVPKDAIQTSKLQLNAVHAEEEWTPAMRADRQFAAHQSWVVSVPASDAGSLLDVAVQAGVNDVTDITWNVADPAALEAKARSSALARDRAMAEQIAQGLGARLGELVYASNKTPDRGELVENFWQRRDGSLLTVKSGDRPKPQIYPEKVRSTTTVYAVFALE